MPHVLLASHPRCGRGCQAIVGCGYVFGVWTEFLRAAALLTIVRALRFLVGLARGGRPRSFSQDGRPLKGSPGQDQTLADAVDDFLDNRLYKLLWNVPKTEEWEDKETVQKFVSPDQTFIKSNGYCRRKYPKEKK